MEKLDQITMFALYVSVFAITLSASAIVWSVSQTTSMREDMNHALDRVEVYEIYVNNLTAELKARGFNPTPMEK